MNFTAITLFCEDIREEKAGPVTLIGVMSDNLQVGALPGALPKLGFYTRISMPVGEAPAPIKIVLKAPDGTERDLGTFSIDVVAEAINQTKAQGTPQIGLMASALMSPFPIMATGRFLTIVRSGSTEKLSGQLNIVTTPAN
jgi:hypothetical protein